MRTTALPQLYSKNEYCAYVCLNSARVWEVDVQLNRTMQPIQRIISSTFMATPLPWQSVLWIIISPHEIHRRTALLRESIKITSAPGLPFQYEPTFGFPNGGIGVFTYGTGLIGRKHVSCVKTNDGYWLNESLCWVWSLLTN